MTVNGLLDSVISLEYVCDSITIDYYTHVFKFYYNKIFIVDGMDEGNYNFTIYDSKNKILLKNKKFLENL